MNDMNTRFKTWRLQSGMTQTEVGKLVGASQNTILRFEKGTSKPRADILVKLLALLEGPKEGGIERTKNGSWPSTSACSVCQTAIPGTEAGAVACLWCGHRFGRRCSNEECGAVGAVTDSFCRECGTRFEEKEKL